MANRRGESASSESIYLGFKTTQDADCCRENKRRKAAANLDGVLKNKDITLLTKVRVVNAVVFPVVMYRGESWTIKKAEH